LTLISDSRFFQQKRSGARLDVFDVKSGEKLHTLLEEYEKIIDVLSVSINGLFVVATARNYLSRAENSVDISKQSYVKIWNAKTGVELHSWDHIGVATAITLTQDNKYIALATEDCRIKILELETGWELLNLVGHKSSINVIKTSNDGKFIISASGSWTDSECCIKVWELNTGLEIKTLEGHTKKITELAITPNDCIALSSSTKPDIEVWDLTTGKLASECIPILQDSF